MQKNTLVIILTAIICCVIMALIDGVLMPGYAVKSAIKLALFLICPFVVSRMDKSIAFAKLFHVQKKGLLMPLLLGAVLYTLLLFAYFLVRDIFDFSAVAGSLTETAGVTKENFLFVAVYISFVNSLLEEFFFRGFLFTNLKASHSRQFAYLFSSVVFALYHVAMMLGWFSLPLFLLCMAGLTAGGMIFNWLNEKQGNIYASWFVHMFANFAINSIGLMLLT